MNTKTEIALTMLNAVFVAASAAILVTAKFERAETKACCDAMEARLAEVAKDAKHAETSMLGAYAMLQTIEERVFKANLEWNESENLRAMENADAEFQKQLKEIDKEFYGNANAKTEVRERRVYRRNMKAADQKSESSVK